MLKNLTSIPKLSYIYNMNLTTNNPLNLNAMYFQVYLYNVDAQDNYKNQGSQFSIDSFDELCEFMATAKAQSYDMATVESYDSEGLRKINTYLWDFFDSEWIGPEKVFTRENLAS